MTALSEARAPLPNPPRVVSDGSHALVDETGKRVELGSRWFIGQIGSGYNVTVVGGQWRRKGWRGGVVEVRVCDEDWGRFQEAGAATLGFQEDAAAQREWSIRTDLLNMRWIDTRKVSS